MVVDGSVATSLEVRETTVEQQQRRARRSLRLWRTVYWSTGLGAVAVAALAGGAGLSDLWGAQTAGLLALAAAVLGAVEKFVSAGARVDQMQARWNGLNDLGCVLQADLADAHAWELRVQQRPELDDDYLAWLRERTAAADKQLHQINTDHWEI